MDISKMHINRPDFKDLKPGINTHHHYAEVVLIEKSPQGSKPVLYQLKKDQISSFHNLDILRHEFIQLPHPAFLLLGEILDVNMNKKTIVMTNNNLVTYKYMLLVANIEHDEETHVALHTLKDALLMDAMDIRMKIPAGAPSHSRMAVSGQKKMKAPQFSVPAPSITKNYKYIENVVQKQMPETPRQVSQHLNTSIKKLCFLQM